jgi:hypothetical protein
MPVLFHFAMFARKAPKSTSPAESKGVGIGKKTPRKSPEDSAASEESDNLELSGCFKTRHYSRPIGTAANVHGAGSQGSKLTDLLRPRAPSLAGARKIKISIQSF